MGIKRSRDDAASSLSECTYHAFLSFRGEDTRKSFTDHLYSALVGAGLRTFRDDDDLERGEDIKSGLEAAITRSRSSIIVFSKDYASSSWCLDELMLILQRKNTSGLVVLPVFYDVDPSSVRRQTGSVSEAFVRHEERFKNEADDTKRVNWANKVKGWRAALTQVANLSGMVLQNEADGYESKFIQKVVSVIEGKVTYNLLHVAPYLVGIDARVDNINVWLRNGSTNVDIIAIYGMGGVGKTTIAEYAFNMNFERFEYRSFLANVREISRQPDGLFRLQTQLLSDILKIKVKKINNAHDGINKIKDAVCRGRVLIVLDDVDQKSQLDAIFGMREWFYPGSKIIVTTRHLQLLKVHGPCEMYVVEEMNFGESLELFSWHAFGDNHPAEGYLEHSNKIIMHCQGLPLALQVLGSSLRGKRVDVWISAMEKLKTIPHCEIQNVLQISYESLQDDHDRELFLDIACFFSGKKKSYVIGVLDECDYHTTVGIENLVDRCLLTIDEHNKLRMHQLLQNMGREIIRKQSPRDPKERSRLWHHKDSFKVLKEENGGERIEGLALNMNMLIEDKSSIRSFNIYNANEANLKTDAFSRMHKLRLLEINYVQLSGCYKNFPKNLRWLCWRGSSMRSLPSQIPLDSLVAIDMRNSNLEQFWLGNKQLGLLKFLNLSHCHRLLKTPDFSKLPALETLILKDCVRLAQIDESIGIAGGLVCFNLRDCKSLKKLPRNIGRLKFLETLIISGCPNLDMLPTEEMKKMESLKVFHADKIPFQLVTPTAARENPSSWREVIWGWVSRPKICPQLPWTCLPRSLVNLSLVGCNLSHNAFPRDFCNVSSLHYLNLSDNPIRFLPHCFKGLTNLKLLRLNYCPRLQRLTRLQSIEQLDVQFCPLLEKITFQPRAIFQRIASPYRCNKLVEFGHFFKLVAFESVDSKIIESLGITNNLESWKNIHIELRNNITRTNGKVPIRGVYEKGLSCNIFSIFFPGNRVPNYFASTSTQSSVSFTVSSSSSPHIGLNICFVYKSVGKHKLHGYAGYFCIMLHNLSKDMKIVCSPVCNGIPEAGKYMIWLCQWKLSSHELEAGDELIVSPLMVGETGFEVKEIGANLLVDDDDVDGTQEIMYPEGRLVGHQGSTPIYFFGCGRTTIANWASNL